MRAIAKTLFNKNHITLTRYDNKPIIEHHCPNEPKSLEKAKVYILINDITIADTPPIVDWRKHWKYERDKKNWKPKYEMIVKESPLGFYYTKTICINEDEQPIWPGYTNTKSKITRELTFRVNPTTEYILTYPLSNGDVSIRNNSSDIRPWQLFDGSMEEHYIFDLLEELNKLFEIAKENKMHMYEKHTYSYYARPEWSNSKTWKDVQIEVYQHIFGDKNGPKFQTNNEKILAAGFDLKTSFRKAKED